MKSSHPLIAAIILGAVLFGVSGCATVEPFSGETVDLAVEHMLHAVAEAAKLSSSRSKSPTDLEMSELTVTLETIGEKKISGDFTLWVVTFDASRDRDFTQSVTVTLKPPADSKKATAMTEKDVTSPHPGMVKALAKGFDTAYLAASAAKEGVQASNHTPLETSSISVEISFTVTGSASASPTVTVFGVDLTVERSRSRENVHQITMKFTPRSS